MELLDQIVVVHYDNLPANLPTGFIREKIEERLALYPAGSRRRYNLSTLKLAEGRDLIQVPAFGDLETAYGLKQQIPQLLTQLEHQRLEGQRIEIAGVTWRNSVYNVFRALNKAGLRPEINYDATDLVMDHVALQGIPFMFNGKPAPVPSPWIVKQYLTATEEQLKLPKA